jgi:hypothetical protein
MKLKKLSLVILGILLFLPFVSLANAQGSYVGVQNSDKFEWALTLNTENWDTYMTDDLETTLENLFHSGSSNLTSVFYDWSAIATKPQSYWSLTNLAIGTETTGQILSPDDNTTITSTPVDVTFGWLIPTDSGNWEQTLYVVNDTSSFLRQTMNLSLAFSFYTMFDVFIVPTTINWVSFVSDFLGVMGSKGGLYQNISATAQSDGYGYSLDVPALGFENNSVAINVNVKYNSKGVLSLYKFSYGGQTLLEFVPGTYIPENERVPDQYIYMFIGLSIIFALEVVVYIVIRKRS